MAVAAGLLDVAVGALSSPIGELFVAVTPEGLAAIAFEGEPTARSCSRRSPAASPPGSCHPRKGRTRGAGSLTSISRPERTEFDLTVDRRLIHGLALDVLRQTAKIPFGEVSTYGEIAQKIGHPTAARAVGRALGSNPIPIVIPCHRVIGASGKLTGYAGGLDRKIALLELEGVLAAG